MAAETTRRNTAVSLRIKPEIDQVWAGLSEYLHMNRTQVVEQALLRMGRQEGLIAGPRRVDSTRSLSGKAVAHARLSDIQSPSVNEMHALLQELAGLGSVRPIPTADFSRDVIYEDHD